MPCALTINRPARFVDALRAYNVVLDGEVVGRIERNQSLTIEAEPGDHRLEFRMNRKRSEELQVHLDEGQQRTVICQARGTGLAAVWWASVEPRRHIQAKLTS